MSWFLGNGCVRSAPLHEAITLLLALPAELQKTLRVHCIVDTRLLPSGTPRLAYIVSNVPITRLERSKMR